MTPIDSIRALPALVSPQESEAVSSGNGFDDFLKNALDETRAAQAEADRAVEQLAAGEARSLHEVMLAMEEADISMRLLVQMRNKVVDAYQEIMRMSV